MRIIVSLCILILPAGLFGKMKGFPVSVEGYYRVRFLTIPLGKKTLNCRSGYARLLKIRPGVTGLVLRGDVHVVSAKPHAFRIWKGHGALLRFHPDSFQGIRGYLKPVKKAASHLECNNIYYLFGKRFCHMGDLYTVPEKGFVGVSLSGREYKNEKVFYTQSSKIEKHPSNFFRFISKISRMRLVAAPPAYRNVAGRILDIWFRALSERSWAMIAPYYPGSSSSIKDSFASRDKMHSLFQNCSWDRASLRCFRPSGFQPVLHNGRMIEDCFHADCRFYTKGKQLGKLRLTFVRMSGSWKIVNFQMSI